MSGHPNAAEMAALRVAVQSGVNMPVEINVVSVARRRIIVCLGRNSARKIITIQYNIVILYVVYKPTHRVVQYDTYQYDVYNDYRVGTQSWIFSVVCCIYGAVNQRTGKPAFHGTDGYIFGDTCAGYGVPDDSGLPPDNLSVYNVCGGITNEVEYSVESA